MVSWSSKTDWTVDFGLFSVESSNSKSKCARGKKKKNCSVKQGKKIEKSQNEIFF